MERKEAIEVIKKNWPDSSFTRLREALEILIPELKESEGERVRKAIIEFFELQDDNTTYSLIPKKDILTWLEKQGEQKPLFKKGDTVIWLDEEFNILDVTKDSYNVGGYIIPIYRQNELSLKQKPADKVKANLLTVERAEKMSPFMKSGFENEPAAWSEEDEKMLCKCIDAASGYYSPEDKQSMKGWLYSIKDRYTWKPSDKQMEALYLAAMRCDEPKYTILIKLYKDLKKLREE